MSRANGHGQQLIYIGMLAVLGWRDVDGGSNSIILCFLVVTTCISVPYLHSVVAVCISEY